MTNPAVFYDVKLSFSSFLHAACPSQSLICLGRADTGTCGSIITSRAHKHEQQAFCWSDIQTFKTDTVHLLLLSSVERAMPSYLSLTAVTS